MGTIYVGDDDSGIRELLKVFISVPGHQVVAVDSGEKLVDIVCKDPNAALVITDNNYRGNGQYNAPDVVREIRKCNPQIPIFVYSTDTVFGEISLSAVVRKAGANEFVAKDIALASLNAKIAEYLRKP